jgi:thiol-disulfide isomerase/thioredoxin
MDIKEALKALDSSKAVILKGMVALVAVIAVALMLSCGNGNSASECPTELTSSGEDGLETDFVFCLYQGEDVLGASVVQLSDLLHKPIVLNFWAGLCPPCREEMPHFQEFYDEFEERINFVGVDVGQFTGLGNPEDAQELLDDLDVTYPAGYTEDSDAVKEYVSGMPTTVFITPAGEVFRSWTGYLSKDKLTEITEEMLAAEVTA